MLKTSLRFMLALASVVTGCKTYHANAGLHDALRSNKPNVGPAVLPGDPPTGDTIKDDPKVADALIIKKLDLPSEVAHYNRSCVIVQTREKADQVIKNYVLETPIDVVPGQDYTVTIEVYLDNEFRYSNTYCTSNRTFTANKGRNIFTLPVCPETGTEPVTSPDCKS